MPSTQRILSIVVSHQLLAKLEPILGRETLDINTVTSGKSSLVLLNNLTFDLILVEHPLPDLEIEQLLAAIRADGSLARDTPVLLLTRERPELLAERYGDPRLTCHSLAASTGELLIVAAGCLGVALRRASRLLVQMEVEVGPARILRACQTIDISESGMLLRTERLLPLETGLELSFSLPDSSRTIAAGARVVRHARADEEGRVGLGVCFTRLEEEDRELLAGFITARAATDLSTGTFSPRHHLSG